MFTLLIYTPTKVERETRHKASNWQWSRYHSFVMLHLPPKYDGRVYSHAVGNVLLTLLLYSDQQMHNYFTNYHTPTCFVTIVSSSASW